MRDIVEPMAPLTLNSYAKINWTLEILGKRADGFHELRTLLQTVTLCDRITFAPLDEGIEVECDDTRVPTDRSNLVWRAANAILELTGLRKGVRISIEKRIPMGAGLGGGSSNAAITLLALGALWETRLQLPSLQYIGASLGSDVPFFLTGGTGLGVGRGEEVYPLPEIRQDFLLLVNPGLHIPTGEVYSGLPPELTKDTPLAKMPLSLEAACAAVSAEIGHAGWIIPYLHNDLEVPVHKKYPLIPEIKARLKNSGAGGVLMSGSGSTIYGVFDSERARTVAIDDLSRTGWWCAPVRTLSRQDYDLEHERALGRSFFA